jgi:transcriptional regulator with XRE-family HTH domain
MSESEVPFVTLGQHLKYVREQSRQSLAQVSGAVEIDEQQLRRIEAGQERPTEDVLMLLISYFGVQDREAVQLWELADYQTDLPDQLRLEDDLPTGSKVVMLLAMDMRTVYSDGLDITANPAGLTFNFTQVAAQPRPGPMPVARIGMSYEQAQMVLKTLESALLHAKYMGRNKQLPPPNA